MIKPTTVSSFQENLPMEQTQQQNVFKKRNHALAFAKPEPQPLPEHLQPSNKRLRTTNDTYDHPAESRNFQSFEPSGVYKHVLGSPSESLWGEEFRREKVENWLFAPGEYLNNMKKKDKKRGRGSHWLKAAVAGGWQKLRREKWGWTKQKVKALFGTKDVDDDHDEYQWDIVHIPDPLSVPLSLTGPTLRFTAV